MHNESEPVKEASLSTGACSAACFYFLTEMLASTVRLLPREELLSPLPSSTLPYFMLLISVHQYS